ncbi:hypothetical protein [Xanthomonas sp. XNM01]|nr:hypothetical protein [Xanthomonas sp. XNM01]
MRLYTAAAERSRRRHLRDQAVNLRAAQFDKSTFKSYLRKLDE